MAKFYNMDPNALFSFLESRKYTRRVINNEIVYIRQSLKDKNVWVKVYTSVAADNGATRDCGNDAIRVCVVWDNLHGRSFGIGKFAKVLRTTSTESILNRVNDRLRLAAIRANQWIDHDHDSRARSIA